MENQSARVCFFNINLLYREKVERGKGKGERGRSIVALRSTRAAAAQHAASFLNVPALLYAPMPCRLPTAESGRRAQAASFLGLPFE